MLGVGPQQGKGTPPVQVGDGTARFLDRQYMKQRGGAVAVLGEATLQELKRTSRFHGSVKELAQHIEDEDDLGVDAVNVALMYQCAGLAVNMSATEIASGVGPSAADPTVTTAAQAFNLSSRPGAIKKIFLDFDGHTTTGTDWNTFVGRDPIVTPPYDKDNSPSTWSKDELSDIVAIWRAVAEDYSMFDVDVTTSDPGLAVLSGNGIRVAIGGAYTDWYPTSAGGVSYVGSFGNTAVKPCFVFPQNLGPNNAKFVWEAVSHEVGHTLSLAHDGVTGGNAYYSGQGDWAPIMGSGYYKSVTQFDKGEYTGSNNQQDDIASISTFLPLLPQENGNSIAAATPLNATVDAATGLATAKASGVVSSADGDWFSFQAVAGMASISAAVTASWAGYNRANLDIQLAVFDATGNAIASINPAGADTATGLGVPVTTVTLPISSTYYIWVSGASAGAPTATGYSSYGSRGQFELTVTFMPCVDCSANATQVPVLPSPSPSPSPTPASPSPSPAPQVMRLTAISLNKVYTDSKTRIAYYCSATITVRDAATLQALPGVNVKAAYSSAPTYPGFDSTAWYTSDSTTVPIRSPNGITAAAGNSCLLTIVDVVKPGYWFNATGSLLSKQIKW